MELQRLKFIIFERKKVPYEYDVSFLYHLPHYHLTKSNLSETTNQSIICNCSCHKNKKAFPRDLIRYEGGLLFPPQADDS
jgi:hypothetical protein